MGALGVLGGAWQTSSGCTASAAPCSCSTSPTPGGSCVPAACAQRTVRCQADIALVLSLPRISAASLKNLLLYCFMHPLYLSTPEGQRTLVFVIGLHVPFFDQIYATLRNQIPGASKAALAAIGDILFRAWRDADGVLLQKIGSSWSAHAHECSCCQTVLTLLPAPAPRAAPPRPLSSPAPRPLPTPALRALSRPPRPAPALRVRSCDCIEYVCLQDLMNHAVHAQANNADAGGMSMAARLRRILSAFHEKKNQPGVRGGRPRKCGESRPKLIAGPGAAAHAGRRDALPPVRAHPLALAGRRERHGYGWRDACRCTAHRRNSRALPLCGSMDQHRQCGAMRRR